MHPFAKSREYTRALTAAKIDRIFAKPFIAALSGHQDGAYCLGRDPRRVSVVAAGGGDGEVIVHSLSTRRPLLKLPQAHKGMVGGVCWTVDEGKDVRRRLVTCGKLDATVKVWKSDLLAPGLKDAGDEEEAWGTNEFGDAGIKTLDEDMDEAGVEDWQEAEGGGLAVDTRFRDEKAAKIEVRLMIRAEHTDFESPLWRIKGRTDSSEFRSLTAPFTADVAAASITTAMTLSLQLLPIQYRFGTRQSEQDGRAAPITLTVRSSPLSTLQFGSSLETVASVKFNQSETSVLASVGNDRTMCLYDIRTGKAERRVVMQVNFLPTSGRDLT